MYNDNNENDSQYRYSGSDIPYNNTNNNSTANNNTAFSSAPYDAKKHKRHKGGLQRKQHALSFCGTFWRNSRFGYVWC